MKIETKCPCRRPGSRHDAATRIAPLRRAGFTLIELMIVVAIIAILAAIALPAYQDFIARAQWSEGAALGDGLKTAVWDYAAQGDACPTNTSPGFGTATSYAGKYVAQVDLGGTLATTGCTIQITFKTNSVAPGIAGTQLVLTSSGMAAANTVGVVQWTCTATAKQRFVPRACTGA